MKVMVEKVIVVAGSSDECDGEKVAVVAGSSDEGDGGKGCSGSRLQL